MDRGKPSCQLNYCGDTVTPKFNLLGGGGTRSTPGETKGPKWGVLGKEPGTLFRRENPGFTRAETGVNIEVFHATKKKGTAKTIRQIKGKTITRRGPAFFPQTPQKKPKGPLNRDQEEPSEKKESIVPKAKVEKPKHLFGPEQ